MSEIKISKVEIEIGNNKLSLTIQEAKKLKEILCDTFPDKEIQWIYPYVYIPEPKRRWDDYTVTWSTSNALCISDQTAQL